MVSLYTFKSLPDYVNVVPLSEFELYLITEINLIVIFSRHVIRSFPEGMYKFNNFV